MSLLRSSAGASKTNDRVAIFLVAVAAMAAIPFGSNRPVFWAVWALVSMIGWITVSVARGGVKGRSRFDLATIRLEQWLFLAVAAAMLLQLAPLGGLLSLHPLVEAGAAVSAPTVSLSPDDTWLAFLRWMTYGILFLLTLQVSVRTNRNRFLSSALAFVVAAEAVYALVALAILGDTILIFEKTSYAGVATGTFINRNSLATFLGIGAILSLSELLRDRSDRSAQRRLEIRGAFGLALGFIIAALLATQSRMGLAATSLGLLTVLLLQLRSMTRGVLFALPLVVGLVAVVAYLYGGGVLDRAFSIENAADSRGELYRQVVAMIGQRPWLGFGAGSFQLVFPAYQQPSLAPDLVWDYAHSTYLSLWAGLGVVVGSLPLLLVAILCIRMGRVWFRTGVRSANGGGSAIPAALGATVLVAVHSLVDFSLEIQAVAIAYTITLALGVAEALGRRSLERSTPRD